MFIYTLGDILDLVALGLFLTLLAVGECVGSK
jgi:hypothetical protein